VTKAVLEPALAGEMTGHLGYEKHDRLAADQENSRQRHHRQDGARRCRGRRTWPCRGTATGPSSRRSRETRQHTPGGMSGAGKPARASQVAQICAHHYRIGIRLMSG
jgi:hypothetical protein